jgi:hypothetical protein
LRAEHGRAARSRAVSTFRREVIWEAVAGEYGALLASARTAASGGQV